MKRAYFRDRIKLHSINVPHNGESVSFSMTDDEGNEFIVSGEYCVDYDYYGCKVVDVCLYDAPTVTVDNLLVCQELVLMHSGF